MPLGETIRKYRKRKNLTQEEMAKRLGVSAPAVNKWENGVSLPDITLLLPIARLLDVSTDTLLSFQKSPDEKEIAAIVKKIDQRSRTEPYEETFRYAKSLILTYPDCYALIWQLALIMDVKRLTGQIERPERYEAEICQWYTRALENGSENVKKGAADSLFGFYVRKEDYETAAQYLFYFPENSTERNQKQALLYSKTGRNKEARQTYEKIVFSEYQTLSLIFHSLFELSAKEGDIENAALWAAKGSALAALFEMGAYRITAPRLYLAIRQKDVPQTLTCAEKLLSAIEGLDCFQESAMYAHMSWKKTDPAFMAQMKQTLSAYFGDEETFGYMKGCREWERLLQSL